MPYKKKIARKSKTVISENVRQFLLTAERAKSDPEVFMLAGSYDRLKIVWDACKSEIMRDWLKKNPCTRPWPWWECDSPRDPVKCWTDMDIKEGQRLRLGGVGTPTFEVLSCGLGFMFGIPMSWIDQWEVDYYTGRARDIDGNLIDSGFKEGDFLGVAYDPNDPPIFESEATYLQCHGFLSDTEAKYLKQHPELLKPQKVEFD